MSSEIVNHFKQKKYYTDAYQRVKGVEISDGKNHQLLASGEYSSFSEIFGSLCREMDRITALKDGGFEVEEVLETIIPKTENEALDCFNGVEAKGQPFMILSQIVAAKHIYGGGEEVSKLCGEKFAQAVQQMVKESIIPKDKYDFSDDGVLKGCSAPEKTGNYLKPMFKDFEEIGDLLISEGLGSVIDVAKETVACTDALKPVFSSFDSENIELVKQELSLEKGLMDLKEKEKKVRREEGKVIIENLNNFTPFAQAQEGKSAKNSNAEDCFKQETSYTDAYEKFREMDFSDRRSHSLFLPNSFFNPSVFNSLCKEMDRIVALRNSGVEVEEALETIIPKTKNEASNCFNGINISGHSFVILSQIVATKNIYGGSEEVSKLCGEKFSQAVQQMVKESVSYGSDVHNVLGGGTLKWCLYPERTGDLLKPMLEEFESVGDLLQSEGLGPVMDIAKETAECSDDLKPLFDTLRSKTDEIFIEKVEVKSALSDVKDQKEIMKKEEGKAIIENLQGFNPFAAAPEQ